MLYRQTMRVYLAHINHKADTYIHIALAIIKKKMT